MSENTAPSATSEPARANHVRQDRSEVVSLNWPVEFNGVTYSTVTVRRMTVADFQAFQAEIDAAEKEGRPAPVRFPMFDAPPEVMDMLDLDDEERLTETANRFLPSRFRVGAA
jgi:hypothetical protein